MSIRSKLSSLREYLTPINNESNFRKTGEISRGRKFLPPEKQFLVTRHVPSYQRVSSYLPDQEEDSSEVENPDSDAEWVPRVNSTPVNAMKQQQQQQDCQNDLDELIEENVEDNVGDDDVDGYTHIESNESTLRKYDLYISYSTSYRMYEDISGDYKDKTATIETLPMSTNTTAVSIHPCKHSSVMRVFMNHAKSRAAKKEGGVEESQVAEDFEKLDLQDRSGGDANEGLDGDETGEIRVDWYLVIFLKFIASVTPGIEYDFTMDAL
ncbi:hypothetical protein CJJ09_004424 [Candidozyma auris]|nr:hypothetical protein CJJ09_004424 [[Candida] auris]